jgi:nitrate/nitrite transport system substrate-binding protein
MTDLYIFPLIYLPGNHSTFLWQSHSIWLMTQAARWGQIKEMPKNADELAKQA